MTWSKNNYIRDNTVMLVVSPGKGNFVCKNSKVSIETFRIWRIKRANHVHTKHIFTQSHLKVLRRKQGCLAQHWSSGWKSRSVLDVTADFNARDLTIKWLVFIVLIWSTCNFHLNYKLYSVVSKTNGRLSDWIIHQEYHRVNSHKWSSSYVAYAHFSYVLVTKVYWYNVCRLLVILFTENLLNGLIEHAE